MFTPELRDVHKARDAAWEAMSPEERYKNKLASHRPRGKFKKKIKRKPPVKKPNPKDLDNSPEAVKRRKYNAYMRAYVKKRVLAAMDY